MNVIRHGNTYKEVKCTECSALLSYCERDVKIVGSCGEIFGEWHDSIKKYVVCPECEEEIILSWVVDGEELIK